MVLAPAARGPPGSPIPSRSPRSAGSAGPCPTWSPPPGRWGPAEATLPRPQGGEPRGAFLLSLWLLAVEGQDQRGRQDQPGWPVPPVPVRRGIPGRVTGQCRGLSTHGTGAHTVTPRSQRLLWHHGSGDWQRSAPGNRGSSTRSRTSVSHASNKAPLHDQHGCPGRCVVSASGWSARPI